MEICLYFLASLGGLRSREQSSTHKILPVFSRQLKRYTTLKESSPHFIYHRCTPVAYEQCSRSVGVFLWLSIRWKWQSLGFVEGNFFHTNKNAEYILRAIARQSKLTWGSSYKYSIPLRAGSVLPSRFACLWAKLIRINQPHCSQVGIVGQLKADTSLGSAGGKLGMVGILPHSSLIQSDAPTILSSLACWLPCETC